MHIIILKNYTSSNERILSFFFQHISNTFQPSRTSLKFYFRNDENKLILSFFLESYRRRRGRNFTLLFNFKHFPNTFDLREKKREEKSNDRRPNRNYPFLHPAVTRLSIPRVNRVAIRHRGSHSTPSAPLVPLFDLLFSLNFFTLALLAPQVRAIPRVTAAPPFPILAFESGCWSACDVPDRVGKT